MRRLSYFSRLAGEGAGSGPMLTPSSVLFRPVAPISEFVNTETPTAANSRATVTQALPPEAAAPASPVSSSGSEGLHTSGSKTSMPIQASDAAAAARGTGVSIEQPCPTQSHPASAPIPAPTALASSRLGRPTTDADSVLQHSEERMPIHRPAGGQLLRDSNGSIETAAERTAQVADRPGILSDRKSTRLNSSHLGISYA